MAQAMLKRTIPSSGEELPVIGLGTWQTFDVSDRSYPVLETVLTDLRTSGARLIDSSPMYGRSEQVVGEIASGMAGEEFFYATKVWTRGQKEGLLQMEESMRKMRRKRLDLIQVHNLTDWQTQLATLQSWKESGKIRYTGITHYTDSSHEELERILRTKKIDFVQFNYSIESRHAERRLLDAAADLGVAVLVNRPLGEGSLFRKTRGKALPEWARDLQIASWGAYFLKYVLGHPAVTCVIPATADPRHLAENLQAGFGDLPNQAWRKKMADSYSGL